MNRRGFPEEPQPRAVEAGPPEDVPMMRFVLLLPLLVLACGCQCSEHSASEVHSSSTAHFQVVPLKYAAAPELAGALKDQVSTLRRSDPDCCMSVDPRTNSVIISARDEAGLAQLLELIARLDIDVPKAH
jgi:hypothetical protein